MPADLELVAATRSALREAADPERAPQMQAYMKSAMPYLGVRVPRVRGLVRALAKQRPPASTEELVATVRALWDQADHREERYAATALAGAPVVRRLRRPELIGVYRHLIVTGAWWDHVDELAGNRVGPILLAHQETVTPVIAAWATDADLWLRRTAILSQLTFKDRTDLALLQAAIEANLEDSSFWIRKAIGWALRQYARTDPDWVRATVAEYDGRLSGLSRREALKHLELRHAPRDSA
jgi:3-methyladenine DNA glycosylase AlkD